MLQYQKNIHIGASALIKTGQGSVRGIFVSAASGSPTIKLNDGITANDESANPATGILTVSGAIVPGAHATSVLTSDATNVADDEIVTIGTTVYRFKDIMLAAYDVQIGADAEISLANLRAAINASGTPGTEYFAGTLAHPLVASSASDATTLTVFARLIGTASNTAPTTETSGHLSWADTTLGGGTGASNPGVVGTAATVTIEGRVYTFVTELSETSGAAAVVDEVLHGGTTAIALDNLKLAINAGATEGVNYSTGTVVNADVEATTNTDTEQTVSALVAGTVGNAITVSETLTNGTWGVGVTTLSGGSEATRTLIDTFIPVVGMYNFSGDLNFATGLYAVIGGTVSCTLIYD